MSCFSRLPAAAFNRLLGPAAAHVPQLPSAAGQFMHVTWRPTLTTLSNCHISSPQQPHRRFSTFSQHAASALPPASNFNDSDDRTDDEVGAHGSSGDDWLQDSDIKRWQPGSVAGGPAAASDGIAEPLAPGLYLVSTPIGNLEDITLRALRVLRSANLVLCEDTRHSGKLLRAYGIRNHTMSYHAHNEKGREAYLLQRLKDGEALALISDAGTPAISDPGAALVAAAVAAGIRVHPIPGPSALLTALVASGLPTDAFLFCGFLPPKTQARQRRLAELRTYNATLAFYAPPHGLLSVLGDAAAVLGGSRRCCVARELTKRFEEFYRGTLDDAAREFAAREPRGEFCLLIEGASAAEGATGAVAGGSASSAEACGAGGASGGDLVRERLAALLADGASVSSASKQVAQQLRISRNAVYDIAQQLRDSQGDKPSAA